jgi:hypothetical protein
MGNMMMMMMTTMVQPAKVHRACCWLLHTCFGL